MRNFIITKTRVLLLCIFLVLTMTTGCANELREQKKEEKIKQEQLEQIEQKWDAVIQEKDIAVAKIKLVKNVSQPIYSSTIQPSISVESSDIEKINSVMSFLRDQTVIFESMPIVQEQMDAYVNFGQGKEFIQITFYDSRGLHIMCIYIYEDGLGTVLCEPERQSNGIILVLLSFLKGFMNRLNLYF